MRKYFITNAIPYVNAKPHIGHALEFIQSDVIARYHILKGDETLLLCGGDENALKNVQAAEKTGKQIQEFIDENTNYFFELSKKLTINFTVWQKGSNPTHHLASQELWKRCEKNGDIYKKKYKGLYCIGCELFYTTEELNEQGECYEHPGKKLEEIEEENYFFALSKYTEKIKGLLEKNEIEIVPQSRKNEMLSFLTHPLEDISISRSNTRAKNWGVPVPGDDTQRMYVWFDALNIYQSGIGFGSDQKKYDHFWPADLHVIGKGIIRFHAIYWPAFLLSAGLLLPKKIFVHEYFTVNGQKMSKTLGNTVDPVEYIQKYGPDALRYYCLAKISPFQDGDFSDEKFKIAYNADLANGLGNLVARVAKLCETTGYTQMVAKNNSTGHVLHDEEYDICLEEFRFNDALGIIWSKIGRLDKYINEEKPWELAKTNQQKLKPVLSHAIDQIQEIASLLLPFLPTTAEAISTQFHGPTIVSRPPLFPRIID